MKKKNTIFKRLLIISVLFIMFQTNAIAQQITQPKAKSEFWKKVQFGGGLGLGFNNGNTNITVSPTAIYNFNQYFSAGLGVQYSYIKNRDLYTSHIYGGSIVGLANPIKQIQLSAELEQLRANVSYDNSLGLANENFWSTALFLGAGYRMQNATFGIRYNVLHNSNNNLYSEAWMPFVRVFF